MRFGPIQPRSNGRSPHHPSASVDYQIEREPAVAPSALDLAEHLRRCVRDALAQDPQWATRDVPNPERRRVAQRQLYARKREAAS